MVNMLALNAVHLGLVPSLHVLVGRNGIGREGMESDGIGGGKKS